MSLRHGHEGPVMLRLHQVCPHKPCWITFKELLRWARMVHTRDIDTGNGGVPAASLEDGNSDIRNLRKSIGAQTIVRKTRL